MQVFCENNDPIAEHYDRLQAWNHWAAMYERETVVRRLAEQEELQPPVVSNESESKPAPKPSAKGRASTSESKEPKTSKTPTKSKVLAQVVEPTPVPLTPASYVVCCIDKMTYVLNPEAEFVGGGGKSK